MAYATQQHLVDRFGADELTQLTDRAEEATGVPDAVVVAAALEDASKLIDGYVARRYALPLATVPDLLRVLACVIARYLLHKDAPSEVVRANYQDALRQLRDVSTGTLVLEAGGAEAPAATGTIQTAGPARVFDHASLKGF